MKTTKYQDGGYVKTPGKTGARASISKTTKTMSGGNKTKTISGGPLVPNAKGSITKTKTNADGSLNKTSTKSISGNRASNKISKYQDGGKVTRGDIKDAQREAKLKRIQAGTEPSTYQKVSDIAGKVADTAVSASQTAKAISDTRRPSGTGGPGMQKGGSAGAAMKAKGMAMKAKGQELKRVGEAKKAKGQAMAKDYTNKMVNKLGTSSSGVRLGSYNPNDKIYQKGGPVSTIKSGAKQVAKGVKDGIKDSIKGAKTFAKKAVKNSIEYKAYKAAGRTAKGIDDAIEKRYPNYTGKGSLYDGAKQGIKTLLGYKTGGMVNPNASVKKQTVPGSRGVKSGVNPSAAASKVARGRVGGTSTAPKKAIPKAQYGMTMRKK